MIYQVTATILFSDIPLLALVRYDPVACSDPITFGFLSLLLLFYRADFLPYNYVTDNENGSFISFTYSGSFLLKSICICKKLPSFSLRTS